MYSPCFGHEHIGLGFRIHPEASSRYGSLEKGQTCLAMRKLNRIDRAALMAFAGFCAWAFAYRFYVDLVVRFGLALRFENPDPRFALDFTSHGHSTTRSNITTLQ